MGIHADDARDQEDWHEMKMDHKHKRCNPNTCPYCNKDFEPLFLFQCLNEDDKEA